MPKRFWVCVFAVLLVAAQGFALTTKSIKDGLKAEEVAGTITGPGATITNVTITGADEALGTFVGGGLGIVSGIVLSSGDIATAVGPNTSSGAGTGLGTDGDSQLDQITAPFTTNDAAILEFDVITETPVFTISYIFASEEYREYVDSEFNDVFAFYVDGHNIALTPGSDQPVTINTINHLRNTGLYRDNEEGSATEFDGFTVPLLAVGLVEPHVTHHIKIAIADTSDAILDSAVFIEQGGISGTTAPVIVPNFASLELVPGQTSTTDLPIFFVFPEIPFTLTADGLPGATITFSAPFIVNGQQFVTMTIVPGPNTPAGTHVVTIHSITQFVTRHTSFVVHIDCRPPVLLGTGQPVTRNVNRGSTTTFTVAPQGSGPFTYQWYSGFTGMTGSPVGGATGATFTTPPITEFSSYWVRITNNCGTFDSNAAFVIPQ